MSKYIINDSTLTAIGTAIRNKAGTTNELTPLEMPTAIANIPSGGDIPEEAFNHTGDLSYWNYNGNNSWLLKLGGHTFNNITNLNYFSANIINEAVDWDNVVINCKTGTRVTTSNAFVTNYKTTNFPLFKNFNPDVCSYMFNNCQNLRYFPEGYFDEWNFEYNYGTSNGSYDHMFNNCYSLRAVPADVISKAYNNSSSTNGAFLTNAFYMCYVIDAINGLPVNTPTNGITNNLLSYTVYSNYRLKSLTFRMNSDGTPIVAKFKNSTLDLSNYIGYCYNAQATDTQIVGYNSGITQDKNVWRDAEGNKLPLTADGLELAKARYNELKNDPDWYSASSNITYEGKTIAASMLFSRYDHDSAVETINSLPDTSAFGTNTIKFKGLSGELTDGGAINNLTEEEIAVAAAKGWTVSIV